MCDPVSATLAVVGIAGQGIAAQKQRKLVKQAETKRAITSRQTEAGIGGINLPQRSERRTALGTNGRSTILTGPGGAAGSAATANRRLLGGV